MSENHISPHFRFNARHFSGSLAGIALAAALWAAIGNSECDTCRAASVLVGGGGIAWAGVMFYVLLVVAIAGRGLTRGVKAAFVAAAGVHAVLLGVLASERIFCAPCVVAGTAAIVGAAIVTAHRPRQLGWAGAIFTVAVVVTSVTLATVSSLRSHDFSLAARQVTPNTQPTTLAAGHVKLVVYEREGCKHCLEFEEQILPRLKEAMGDAIEVERLEAGIAMQTPTIIVQGKGEDREFTGVPEYQQLEDAVRDLQ